VTYNHCCQLNAFKHGIKDTDCSKRKTYRFAGLLIMATMSGQPRLEQSILEAYLNHSFVTAAKK
jgi:hypothetical protein